MVTLRRSLWRTFCLLTFFVELCWIHGGYGMHREAGSKVLRQWERRVRGASSLDELLRLADFPDWKLWKCRLRLQQAWTHTELPSSQSTGSHRSTRYAAESYSLEILKAVDEEWQRTQCMPRETCVDVAKELGTEPSVFFKPPCVSIHRCSGCCNQEGVTCRNITTVYVNKTVLSLIPFKFFPEPVLIKVANHTECRCLEPAIIRRDAQPDGGTSCSPVEPQDSKRLCASGLIWDCSADRCIAFPSSSPELLLSSWLPDCEMDVEQCECVQRAEPTLQSRAEPRCPLNASTCAQKNQRFDPLSCRCKWQKSLP